MKFIVSSSSLLKQLQHISGVISANTVLPILEDFYFQINKNELTVIATDLETVMKVQLEVEAREKVRICIPAKILLESLKNIADQPLTFDIDPDSFAVEITSDNGKYKIMGESPENFPKEPQPDETSSFTMVSSSLLTAINKTIFATSNDDLRPAMTGVLFELEENAITFVATDAHRLVKYVRKDVHCPEQKSFVVPKKPLNLVKNILSENSAEVKLSFNSNHLFIHQGNSQLVCRLIDARFPDYRVVIPLDNPYRLTVNKVDFQNALKRVVIFSNKSTNQVALQIAGSELQLSAQDVDFSFEGNERMPCQYNGEDMQIAFNAKFLLEMLTVSDGEEIFMELSTPSRAGLIKSPDLEEQEDLVMLIMPLMIG
ncbi:MAG: DNA polymerase III subunit beta [Chitinophagaceae bacterium]